MKSTAEITSISTKGQVVIPKSIRDEIGIGEGTKLVVFTDGNNVLLKPVEVPKKELFKKLIQESRKWAKDSKLNPSDVPGIIKKARHESRT